MGGDRRRGASAGRRPAARRAAPPSGRRAPRRGRRRCCVNVRQRNAGSGPESRIRSRGARGMRTAWTSNSGQSIVRVIPSSSRTIGRVAWKSTNSSGSIRANDSAPRLPAMNVRADVADSPASFQPLNAHTSAGARSPSGRRSQRSGCMRSTVPRPLLRPPWRHVLALRVGGHDRRPARRGRGRRRLRLLAQGPADGALGHALPGARAARPDRRDPGARLPGRRRAGGPLRARRPRAGRRAASSASATSCRSTSARSPAPSRPTRPRSCRSPTATSTSSTASSSTSRARSTTRRYRGAAGAAVGR